MDAHPGKYSLQYVNVPTDSNIRHCLELQPSQSPPVVMSEVLVALITAWSPGTGGLKDPDEPHVRSQAQT
jgi:hypothetical protein